MFIYIAQALGSHLALGVQPRRVQCGGARVHDNARVANVDASEENLEHCHMMRA